MSTLYRDYRPQTFKEVLGQNHIKITLEHELESDKIANAYLFCGPRAVGKTTMARIMAKALNCENRQPGSVEPCGQCPSCLSITAGKNLDVIEIDAASNTGVDNVRENIIASARVASFKSRYRVFIIDEVHMLSVSAWNALLKILEEPPHHVLFILCTTEIHKVPGTIISRCERFDFKRISVSEIINKLNKIISQEGAQVDQEVIEAVARQASGHLRDAESLLGQILALNDGKITIEQAELIIPRHHNEEIISLLELLKRNDAARAIRLVNNLIDGGFNLKNFLEEAITILRKILLNKVNPGLADSLGLDLGESLELRLSDLTKEIELEKIIIYTEAFLELQASRNPAFISQLPLELKIAELCLDSNLRPAARHLAGQTAPLNQTAKPSLAKKDQAVPALKNKSDFCLEQAAVLEKWPEFLIKVRQQNHALSFILQNCQPGGIETGELEIAFKYKFHRDHLNDHEVKQLVEMTLSDIFGAAISVKPILDEQAIIPSPAKIQTADSALADKLKQPEAASDNNLNNNLLDNLLNTFGGEVIS
jgi:DNA polymerase-3 subunit gamma/tau